jgi:hypothetical protein
VKRSHKNRRSEGDRSRKSEVECEERRGVKVEKQELQRG